MPTTSNFGWTTPADTDLVKDGAAAIRTLGNGIDTSLLDLKGGTSGQVLSKNSNTDLDYTWVTPNVGDITEVQAGTGISVASGTGPIPVVTNSMATEITAKGDLIVGTGSGTFDNLPAGTNGHILVADSSVSPTGLKWAAPAPAGFKGCSVYNSATISLANNTLVALTFDSENYDTDAFHSTSSNTGRITIPAGLGGKYLINGIISYDGGGAGFRRIDILKNGTLIVYGANFALPNSAGGTNVIPYGAVLDLVATDYVSISVNQESGGTINTGSGASLLAFNATYLGA